MLAKLKLGQPPENDDEDNSEEFHFVQEKVGRLTRLNDEVTE